MIIILIVVILTPIFNSFITTLFLKKSTTISLGLLILIIFVVGKYIWWIFDAINFYRNGVVPDNLIVNNLANSSIINSILLSNLLLLNIPDLLFLLLGISLIFNGNKCISKTLSIIALVFTIPITISTLIGDFSYNDFTSTMPVWKYLLIGNGIQRMPFITNLILIFTSLSVYLSAKQYSRWSILSSYLILSFIFIYLKMVVDFTNIQMNASGFSIFDWGLILDNQGRVIAPGVFYPINKGMNNLLLNLAVDNFAVVEFLFSIMIILMMTLLIISKNIFTRDKHKIVTIYQPWYHNSFLFREPFYRIDSWINTILSKYLKRDFLYGLNKSRFFALYYNRFINTKEPIINNIQDTNDNSSNSKKTKKSFLKPKDKQNIIIADESIENNTNQSPVNNIDNQISNQILNNNISNEIINQPYLEDGKWYFKNEVGEKFIANESGNWERIN